MQKQLPFGTVTFLFTDIQGSTPLWEQMPKEMQKSIELHHTILREAIETNNGVVFQIIGDAFQAAFWRTIDGLQAALTAQRLLKSAAWERTGPIKVRMGLHTGPAEVEHREGPWQGIYAVSHTLNRAARIMSAGQGGQILISQETADLLMREELPKGAALRDMGQHHLKGLQRLEHIYQATAFDLLSDFPPLATSIDRPNNLPVELSSFIGRKKEIEEVIKRLEQNRLVTLTGTGGTGKTRLSLETASRLLENNDHGVWFVELASINDPAWLAQTIANVFNLREAGGEPIEVVLAQYLRSKQLLLVLDNCEHMVKACAKMVELLLRASPGLRVLASSREVLGVSGEAIYRVPSLGSPQVGTVEGLYQSDAARLFIERASAASHDFRVTEANAQAVMQICTRLDGIAHALELAASRVRVMSVEQIAARLDDRFRLLTGGSRTALPHQQTLRAAIDWSYHLLSDRERNLLHRLAVFSGGWTLEAAAAICADTVGEGGTILNFYEVLDELTLLVNKSLVIADLSDEGEIRYRMLETIRHYAGEKLVGAGEMDSIQDRHLGHFTIWSEQANTGLRGREQKHWTQSFGREVDNVRSALIWGLKKDRVSGLRLAKAAASYFEFTGRPKEAEHWLVQFLSDPHISYPLPLHSEALAFLGYLYGSYNLTLCKQFVDRSIDAAEGKVQLPAMAAIVKGWLALHEGDEVGLHSWLADAERLGKEQKDWYAVYLAKNFLGRHADMQGDQESAWKHWMEMGEVAQASGNPRLIAWTDLHLALIVLDRGDLARARKMIEQARETLRDLGETTIQFTPQAFVYLLLGDTEAAQAAYREFIEFARDREDSQGELYGLSQLGYLAFLRKDDSKMQAIIDESIQIMNQENVSELASRAGRFFIGLLCGEYLAWMGDFAQSEAWLNQVGSLQLDQSEEVIFWKVSGVLLWRRGILDEAADLFYKSLSHFYHAHSLPLQVEILEYCAGLKAEIAPALAVKLLGAVDAARSQMEMPRYPRFVSFFDHLRHQLVDHLGENVFQATYAAGFSQPLEQMVAETLSYLEKK